MARVHMGRLDGANGFSRLVAVKRMHPFLDGAAERYALLRDEARISSRIRHANVVPTIDVVEEDGALCLVMEYVAGLSWAELVRAAHEMDYAISPSIAAAVVVDLLRGLHAAHEAKAEDGTPLHIVHRDVSPHNVLVGADGVTRVLDFGVAKALHAEHLTVTGEVKGKIGYMSPEMLRGVGVTRQADVFASGIVLWEALTGERLYGEGDPGTLMHRILTEAPVPPSARKPGLPKALDAVVMRAMAAEPRARFATAEEMAVALADACPPAEPEQVVDFVQYVAGERLQRRADLARDVENWRGEAGAASAPSAPVLPPTHASSPSRLPLAIGVGVVALVLGFLGARALGSRAPSPVASASAQAASTPVAPPPSPADSPAAQVGVGSADVRPAVDVTDPPGAVSAAAARPSSRPPRNKPRAPSNPARQCQPPYSMDDTGRKHYKPECLP